MLGVDGVEIRGDVEDRQEEVLSGEALAFVAELERRFGARRTELLRRRAERQERLAAGENPDFLAETREIRESEWTTVPPPRDLQDRRVEITGPVERKMMINALNSGARVFMADFPDAAAVLRRVSSDTRRRALFRAYMGYASGSGATTAMLDEARRRTGRGTDAVVAAYRVHGRPEQALAGLDVLGGVHPGVNERPLNLEEVLARNPQVVVIDDLAELDSKGRPRLEAVPALLGAGITVLATLHLLSVKSAAGAVSALLDHPLPGAVIDDEYLTMIDELEVVDVPPAELLQRIAEHEILTPAQRAVAMQNELRPRVLETLRETALRMCANQVDRQFVQDLRESDGSSAPEVRGRIVLCLPVLPGLEERIRFAAKYARFNDATFTVVTVKQPGLTEEEKRLLGTYAALAHQMGGEFVRLEGRLVARTLARFIRESLATEVILGHRRRSRWRPWDTTSELIRLLEGVDIHVLRRRA